MSTFLNALIFSLAGLGVSTAIAQENLTINVSGFYQSNLGNADRRADKLEDWVISTGASYAKSILLTERTASVFHAGLNYDRHIRYEDLSRLDLSMGAKYRVQPVIGFTRPWMEVSAKLDVLQHQDSEIRDGVIAALQASLGQQMTDRIKLVAGAVWEQRHAQSAVFDTRNQQFFAKLDYRCDERNLFYMNGSVIKGDQVSTASIPVSATLRAQAEAITPDIALSGSSQRNAYQVQARANLLELGWNYALSGSQAVDAGLKAFDVDAEAGLQYQGVVLQATYLYRLP